MCNKPTQSALTKRMTRILMIGLLMLIVSCSSNANKKINSKRFCNPTQPKYTYRTYMGGYTREAYIKELDTSKWILKSYWIIPSNKSVINLDSSDSLLHFKLTNYEADSYIFKTSSNNIFKNGLKIGTITKDKTDFGNHKNRQGELLGIRYHTIFNFSQSEDSILNGLFNITYSRFERLHLSQVRINNKTKKKELVRLIFYKKKHTHNTK